MAHPVTGGRMESPRHPLLLRQTDRAPDRPGHDGIE
jgi:hypothetical protein